MCFCWSWTKTNQVFCPEAVHFTMFKALIILVLALSMTLTALAQSTPEATPEAATDSGNVLADCIKLLPADRPVESGANAPSLRIVQPTTDVVYGSAVSIQIQTKNFDVNADGQHWHL